MATVAVKSYFLGLCQYYHAQLDAFLEIYKADRKNSNIESSTSLAKFQLEPADAEKIQNALENFAVANYYANFQTPFTKIMEKYNLNAWQIHCLMLAFVWQYDPTFAEKMSKNIEHYGEAPTLWLAAALYRLQNPLNINGEFHQRTTDIFHHYITENYSAYWHKEYHLKPDVISFLLDEPLEATLANYAKIIHPEKEMPLSYERTNGDFVATFSATDASIVTIFTGDIGTGRTSCVSKIANKTGEKILEINSPSLTFHESTDFTVACEQILTYTNLGISTVYFKNLPEDYKINPEQNSLIEGFFKKLIQKGVKIIVSCEKINHEIFAKIQYLEYEIRRPDLGERVKLWQELSAKHLLDNDIDFEVLSSQFSITPKQILDSLTEAANLCNGEIDKKTLVKCCYHQVLKNLADNAQAIEANFSWADIVLPADLEKEIKDATNHVKLKNKVYQDWGFAQRFSYGTGTNMMFTGPPGTGKTMLAQVIANDLQMELYRIDLSAVVSKYIGETEKNLAKIFADAENSGVILFFDEVDALFGKRGETNSANDKYANMETAYLLQKIENYDGVIIMATNYLGNIDEAFMRRIHFIFTIPFPEKSLRKTLWHKALGDAPLDQNVDFDFLAERFEISGALIKNIGLSVAFFAAKDQLNISMSHIVPAIYLELSKQGKVLIAEDFGDYAFILKEVLNNE